MLGLVFGLFTLPWLLFITGVRPPLSLLGWAATVLWVSWLLSLILQGPVRDAGPLERVSTPVGLTAIFAVSVVLLVQPEEVLFLVQESSYPWFQVMALALLIASGPLLYLRFRRGMGVGEPIEEVTQQARAGRRRVPPVVDQVRDVVALRAATVLRCAVTAVVVLVGVVVQVAWTWSAFLDGWILLLLVPVLTAEVLVHRWGAESLSRGIGGADPSRGQTMFAVWWGLSWGAALVLTARASAATGGIRPEPLLWYAFSFAAVLGASLVVFPVVWARRDALFVWWLRGDPRRRDELAQLGRELGPQAFGRLPNLD